MIKTNTSSEAMKQAMLQRIKRLKMNRDNAPNQITWAEWNSKFEDATLQYNNL